MGLVKMNSWFLGSYMNSLNCFAQLEWGVAAVLPENISCMEHLYITMSCPPVLEENELLTSHNSAATVLATGFLVDLNLDGSTPDTYRSPPAPIPYDVVLGRPQSIDTESLRETINGSVFENLPFADLKESHCTTDTAIFLSSPKKLEVELLKSDELNVSEMEEEDVCPTCLEDYDAENPKIITKCPYVVKSGDKTLC
ncbi:hypothetical protein HYC85_016457 [Camellia sinensis]|uniref:RING-type E3 ubiquitin transferase n=1 Tax=Camellia sinensis TaxID=4442 RepID=A0A7J7GZR9_CAMSI|nr:hypothetical protein HYC85_016457 [Camellia sinensis]